MSKARQLADLLDSNGDVVVGALDNAPDPDLTPYAELAGASFTGNLLVGTTDVDPATETGTNEGVALQSDRISLSRNDGTTLLINRTSTDGEIVRLNKDGSTVGSIGTNSSAPYLVTAVGSNTVGLKVQGGSQPRIVPTNGSGVSTDAFADLGVDVHRWRDLYLSGGVYLGGTGSDNYLDDYEEGEWTLTAVNTSNWSGFASTTVDSYGTTYTKVGRTVSISGQVLMPDSGDNALSAGDYVQFGGLPFAYGGSGDGTFSRVPSLVFRRDNDNGGVTHCNLVNSTEIQVRVVATNGNGRRRQQGLNFSFTYFTDA